MQTGDIQIGLSGFNDLSVFVFVAGLLVVATGLAFFLFPRVTLNHLKLAGAAAHPEAFGEARSSFAGFFVATGVLVLATQAGALLFALALSLAIAALGKFIHIIFDGGRQASIFIRFAVTALLATLLLPAAALEAGTVELPRDLGTLLPTISAVVTIIFGLACFLVPSKALQLMRLRPIDGHPHAKGEVRGMLAGFYLGVGLTVLLVGGFHPALLIGFAWLATAFGRMISMLGDGTNNVFNWVSLLLELVLAVLPLSVVLGLTG